MVPLTIDGETIRLAAITYTPPGNGPFPVLIFHHSSTGRGTDPTLFDKPYGPVPTIDWFVRRGYAVVLPSRRGRGGSEGCYDEGFALDRTQGCSCDPTLPLPGADRAVRDIDAVTDRVLAQPFADRSRFVVGGQSRGGVLTIAWSGRRPGEPRAAGRDQLRRRLARHRLSDREPRQHTSLFGRGAAYGKPTLWLYSENDRFYPLSHSRANFAAYRAAGGQGSFHEFVPAEGRSGHGISFAPALWGGTVEAYLAGRGLPATAQ
jgi:dienelactone hydrolase